MLRPPTVSRRRVLVGAAALAALSVTAAGCADPPPPPDLDDLTTALDRARSDAELASDVAETAVSYTHLTLPTMSLVCRSRWSPYH